MRLASYCSPSHNTSNAVVASSRFRFAVAHDGVLPLSSWIDFGFTNRFERRSDDLVQTSCGSPCYAARELIVSKLLPCHWRPQRVQKTLQQSHTPWPFSFQTTTAISMVRHLASSLHFHGMKPLHFLKSWTFLTTSQLVATPVCSFKSTVPVNQRY